MMNAPSTIAMAGSSTPAATPSGRLRRTALLISVGLLGLAAVVALLILAGGAELLKPAGGEKEGLKDFIDKVEAVKKPATAAFAATSGLGLLAGAAMTGMGMQSGIRMMTLSGLAGGGVVLGNGVIA